MNIIYISNSKIPSTTANSVHVMKMSEALVCAGYSVTLFAPDYNSDTEISVPDVFDYYAVNGCFDINKMYPVHHKGWTLCYGYFASRRAKKKLPDIVYTRSVPAAFFSCVKGMNVILECHAPLTKFNEILFKILVRKIEFNKLVVITDALKIYYENRYPILSNKIIVAPDGADRVSEKDLASKNRNFGSRLQVGYSGHLYQGKGMELIYKLALQASWADFNILGGTLSDINYWAEKCKDIENIKFHGHVAHSAVRSYLVEYDVLLLPNQKKVLGRTSRNKDIGQWTSPLKAFEYMALRKPIIASDLDVLKEVFEDEFNALLCNPVDINEWVIALKRIRSDRDLCDKISNNAFQVFNDKYTWRSRVDRILENVKLSV